VTHNASAAMVDDRTVEMHDGRISRRGADAEGDAGATRRGRGAMSALHQCGDV
jgi:hypothetical protein